MDGATTVADGTPQSDRTVHRGPGDIAAAAWRTHRHDGDNPLPCRPTADNEPCGPCASGVLPVPLNASREAASPVLPANAGAKAFAINTGTP